MLAILASLKQSEFNISGLVLGMLWRNGTLLCICKCHPKALSLHRGNGFAAKRCDPIAFFNCIYLNYKRYLTDILQKLLTWQKKLLALEFFLSGL